MQFATTHRPSARLRRAMIAILSFACSLHVAPAQQQDGADARSGTDVRIDAATLFARTDDAFVDGRVRETGTQAIALDILPGALAAMRGAARLRIDNLPLPGGERVSISLENFSIFDERSVAVVVGKDGERRVPLPDVVLFKGFVPGEMGSWVFLAVAGDGVSGSIARADARFSLYTTHPASAAGSPRPVLSIFEPTAEMGSYECGVTEDDVLNTMRFGDARASADTLRDTLVAAIALDVDQSAQQHYGGTQNATDYVTARMGESSAIYERDLTIKLKVSFLRVWETPDPFPGNSDTQLLNVFTQYWKNNEDDIERTLAALITRKPISGGGVAQGVAWLDQLCSKDHGYSMTKFSANDGFIEGHVGVLAHELGHNFGAPHTHSCWWNPPVDSCYRAEPLPNKTPCFSTSDQHLILGGGELMSYCHLSFGNRNKFNVYRARVGTRVRTRTEEALCVTVAGLIYKIAIEAPAGGESVCSGTSIDIKWTASGVNGLSVWLSRNDGATYDTMLAILPRSARQFTWSIPGGFPAGTRYRLKVKDNRNDTLFAVMASSFEIKPGTQILTQVRWRNVCVGQGANFNLTASGPGTLRYQWKRNGNPINGATTNNLQLEGMTLDNDHDNYTCVVTSDCGSVESDSAILRVYTGPVIVQHPNNDTVCIGGRAVLRIVAEGPDLHYKWLTLGHVFDVDSPEFTVDNVQQTVGYYCEVSSPCGKVQTRTGFAFVPTTQVSFLTPKPYEELTAGGTFDIRWKQFCIADVKIEYSMDGGTGWNLLAASVPASDASFTWNVPRTETTNGAFRITDLSTPTRTAISPTFIIKQRPTATFSATIISFGLTPVGTPIQKSTVISNFGSVALDVTRTQLEGAAGVVVQNGAPFSVPPAQSYTLTLEWTPQASGPLQGQLVIDHNAVSTHDTLALIGDGFVTTAARNVPAPSALALSQNYPNPVRLSAGGRTTLDLDLPVSQQVRLTLANVLGSDVAVLADRHFSAGRQRLSIDLSAYPAGVYLVRVATPAQTLTRVVHVLR